jgi:hypothetical protein
MVDLQQSAGCGGCHNLNPPGYQWLAERPSTANKKKEKYRKTKVRVGVVMAIIA